MEKRFNLLDEPWIPVEDRGKVGLKDVFLDDSFTALGGNPLQKMAIYKFLFLIAQRSCGFLTEAELRDKGQKGIAEICLKYLEENRELFYLYGDRAFLQYPEIKDNDKIEYKTMYIDYLPDLASENDSIIKESQTRTIFSDAEKALFLVFLQAYALGGKRTTKPKDYVESNISDEREKNARTAPSLSNGMKGYVQSLIIGKSILETVFLNYFTKEDVSEMRLDSLGLSIIPPWEKMPTFTASEYNSEYKNSFCAWFVPMTRFVLLGEENKIKYCEGLRYSGEWHDPFLTDSGSEGRKETVDILKKPWNQIQALLAEVYNRESSQKKCLAVSLHYLRAKETTEYFSIWTGGLSLNAITGDQFVKNEDDYLESCVTFNSDILGDEFFSRYCSIVENVNACGTSLQKSINAYKKQLKVITPNKKDKKQSQKMESVTGCMFSFWYEMGKLSEDFVRVAEDDNDDNKNKLFKEVYRIERNIYDDYCQHGTARQLLAWAKNRP